MQPGNSQTLSLDDFCGAEDMLYTCECPLIAPFVRHDSLIWRVIQCYGGGCILCVRGMLNPQSSGNYSARSARRASVRGGDKKMNDVELVSLGLTHNSGDYAP